MCGIFDISLLCDSSINQSINIPGLRPTVLFLGSTSLPYRTRFIMFRPHNFITATETATQIRRLSVCVCGVFCHPIHSGRQTCGRTSRGSHRRKVTQDFPVFLLRHLSLFLSREGLHLPLFLSREGFSRPFPWSTVK